MLTWWIWLTFSLVLFFMGVVGTDINDGMTKLNTINDLPKDDFFPVDIPKVDHFYNFPHMLSFRGWRIYQVFFVFDFWSQNQTFGFCLQVLFFNSKLRLTTAKFYIIFCTCIVCRDSWDMQSVQRNFGNNLGVNTEICAWLSKRRDQRPTHGSNTKLFQCHTHGCIQPIYR